MYKQPVALLPLADGLPESGKVSEGHKHKVGFWVGLRGRQLLTFDGDLWERNRVASERELFFACIHLGIMCLRVRVSMAGP